MASELRVNTLKDASGNNSIGMSYVAEGSAKSWINFNGNGTPAARDSFNFSSITDNATGDYTVNISNSFATANYVTHSSATYADGNTSVPNDAALVGLTRAVTNPQTTSSGRYINFARAGSGGTTFYDAPYILISSIGDLA